MATHHSNTLPTRTSVEATIQKFEDAMAIIALADGQTLRWPIKQLPDDCKVGSVLRVTISTAADDHAERAALAKTILNEVLNGNS